MKKYRVAVIGTGYIGAVHCEQLLRLPNVMLAGVADKNPRLASEAAQQFGAEKIYQNAGEVIADRTIDVIHNCTPNNLHYEINKQALESGKQVFSEKPLALSAKESSELTRLAEKKKAVTGINFCYRYYPVVQEAAVRIARGEIGTVYNIMGNYLQDWLLYPTDYSWRLDASMSGASNIVGDLGSHWCDLAQFVSGLKITEVMAELKTILPVRKRPKNKETLTFSAATDSEYEDVKISLDEYCALLLRFDNGASGTFTTSELAAGRKCNIDLQVYGSESSLAWNHERSAELWLGHRDKPNQIFFESPNLQAPETRRFARLPSGHPMGYMDAILNLFRDFYQAIELKEEDKKPDFRLPDFQAGHEEMLILEAAIRSRESGAWAKIGSANI
ncbi:MAG: Gfo/Idh/MocA family oxidoreductase [Candidatus Omnitrophica bacterium]|nr:Gfo/Idh/MocA family oxidoreductase [Candidatus Omnitrophota bacterium]